MKKIMIIINLSIFVLMSTAWAQMKMSTGLRLNTAHDDRAGVVMKGHDRLSTGLRTNKATDEDNLRVSDQRIEIPDEVIHAPREFKGQSIIPAVFAYHCNNHEYAVQNCGGHTVPYGSNLFTDVHYTHTWFQIMNTSGMDFSYDNSKMIIYVYGQNGKLIDVNGGPAWHSYGIIDLLHPKLCGTDGFKNNESIFFYFGTWMHDEAIDRNPPYSAKIELYANVPYDHRVNELKLCIHVGWEEIIEDDDGQRYAKGGTLIDKETVYMKPQLVIQEQSQEELLELIQ
ncbi:MAG: hypothetical protein OMM_02152 [Candidatus Magnetoglobus multicellularis str. Araruama]|uniref:Uncharacterized protein n=1 Tax=Candidatus Magnetoglobus multicellularis str. Araruama TaxID=890399 RepID=A0A1V1PAP7_9BACT|nr:MAG: hypothetical protein OMM_02152 [Candidatus Magnetoglobus multicellularis str. Araruama]